MAIHIAEKTYDKRLDSIAKGMKPVPTSRHGLVKAVCAKLASMSVQDVLDFLNRTETSASSKNRNYQASEEVTDSNDAPTSELVNTNCESLRSPSRRANGEKKRSGDRDKSIVAA